MFYILFVSFHPQGNHIFTHLCNLIWCNNCISVIIKIVIVFNIIRKFTCGDMISLPSNYLFFFKSHLQENHIVPRL